MEDGWRTPSLEFWPAVLPDRHATCSDRLADQSLQGRREVLEQVRLGHELDPCRAASQVIGGLLDLKQQRVGGHGMGQKAAVPRHLIRRQVPYPLRGEHKSQPRPALMHIAG